MSLNISAVSVGKNLTSLPPLSPTTPARYLHAFVAKAVAAGSLGVWSHSETKKGFSLAVDVPGFGLFPQNPCLCISFLPLFLTQPSVFSLCLSSPSLPPNCADKQPGAMAAEEVTCGILSVVLFASAGHLSFSEAEGMGLNMVPLSASHLCCD